MFIDTHAHLNFKAFKDDYKAVIKRAFEAGVKGIINVGSNLATSLNSTRIAHGYECDTDEHGSGVWAAVGLHPIHVADENFDFNKYLELAKDPKVVAVGETGIDLYHPTSPRLRGTSSKKTIDLQRDVFEKSLKIAHQVNKPIILHCRDGEGDLRAWLMGQQVLPKGVIHCFLGNLDFAKFVLDLGFLISFTGMITFSKNQKTMEVIREVPLEKIMIETDCPFLCPEPQRSDRTLQLSFEQSSQTNSQGPHPSGVRNEPAYVIEVAKKIAEIKKIPLEKVEEQTTRNAIKLFNLDL